MTNEWFPAAGVNKSARFRLFCFPHAGGGASAFGNWTRLLPASVEVAGVHLPGREERLRTAAFSRLDPLLSSLTEALRPYLDLPFAFYGHSLGGWLAFYLARRLRRDGLARPVHIFVAASRAPQLESKHPPIHALSPDLFLQELGRRYNNVPAAVRNDPELLSLLLPALRADFELMESIQYHHEVPLDCPISAYGGQWDPMISQAEVSAWDAQTSASFSVEMMPGDHFFVKSQAPAFLDRLYGKMGPYLDRTRSAEHAARL
jgi:medium-chain acyl-[acyl-carrier-protein] hydrolase